MVKYNKTQSHKVKNNVLKEFSWSLSDNGKHWGLQNGVASSYYFMSQHKMRA